MNLIELGQSVHCDDRKYDGSDAADVEQDLPAVVRNERRGCETGERTADRHHSGGNDGERGAQMARRRFGVDRHHVGDHAADAEPGDGAQPEQLREVRRISGPVGEDAEQDIAQDQCGLAAVAVADPAENLRTEQHAEIARGQHEAERLRRNVPVMDEMRCGKSDGADVIAVDEGDQRGPEDELDLEGAQPVLVQKPRYINIRFAGHRSHPIVSFLSRVLPARRKRRAGAG